MLVVSGYGGKPAFVLQGRGMFVSPFVRSAEFISLSMVPFSLHITLPHALTSRSTRVSIRTVAIVKLSASPLIQMRAAVRLLQIDAHSIQHVARGLLEGLLRQVVTQMELHELARDVQRFQKLVHEAASSELEKLGLELLVWTIEELRDFDGRLDNAALRPIAAQIGKAERDVVALVSNANISIENIKYFKSDFSYFSALMSFSL